MQCSMEPVEPRPGASSELQNIMSPNKSVPIQVDLQLHSPNRILHIFTQKLQAACSSSTADADNETLPKKVVPRLRQSTYGEVLTTTDILKKLEDAEQKKTFKRIIIKKPNKASKKIEQARKKDEVKKALTFTTQDSLVVEDNSDEDNLPLSSFINRRSPEKQQTVEYKEVKWDNLQSNTFILAKFQGLEKNATVYKYVCIIQQKDEDDGEIGIVGLRSLDDACTDFFINEITTSYVTIEMIEAILPDPETKFVGRKIVYSFPGKINIFEKP